MTAKDFLPNHTVPFYKSFSIRVLLAISATNDYELMKFDVKTAFIYSELEEVYMTIIPSTIENQQDLVCKLKKSLYGLKSLVAGIGNVVLSK
ncbi:hypothetical protein JTB14_019569 [Gonioctena quinquepunctata]|nr:hypothetical protein JTB14_019569 [Gonioctena quinquepunctata]